MQRQIFREKSVERISSPEQLQDYMRVTGPGIWMVLLAVIVLLTGLIVASALVRLESTVPVRAVVEEDGTTLQIMLPREQTDRVKPGMTVRVADRQAKVRLIFQQEDGMQAVAAVDGGEPLTAGAYDAQLVTETITPISFLFNRADLDE